MMNIWIKVGRLSLMKTGIYQILNAGKSTVEIGVEKKKDWGNEEVR